jgi:hypothetical protein
VPDDARDAKEYRRQRELLKAMLQARRVDAPDEYLGEKATPLPAGYKTPKALAHYENYIPVAVRRAALRANHRVRGITSASRKHRATGGRKGPRIDDTDLGRHVFRLVQEYLLSRIEAERELAGALVSAEGVDNKSARARMRRALRRLG